MAQLSLKGAPAMLARIGFHFNFRRVADIPRAIRGVMAPEVEAPEQERERATRPATGHQIAGHGFKGMGFSWSGFIAEMLVGRWYVAEVTYQQRRDGFGSYLVVGLLWKSAGPDGKEMNEAEKKVMRQGNKVMEELIPQLVGKFLTPKVFENPRFEDGHEVPDEKVWTVNVWRRDPAGAPIHAERLTQSLKGSLAHAGLVVDARA